MKKFIFSMFLMICAMFALNKPATCEAADISYVTAVPVPVPAPVTNAAIEASYREACDESKLVTSGIYTYRVINEAMKLIEIRGINTIEESVVIPDTIDGYKVFCIGYNNYISSYVGGDIGYDTSCYPIKGIGKKTLRNLVIPEGVKLVGAYALDGYVALEKVTLPESITEIHEGAFKGCVSLNNVVIPSKATVKSLVFNGCTALTNVTSNTGKKFGDNVFNNDLDVLYYTATCAESGNAVNISRSMSYNDIDKIVIDSAISLVNIDNPCNTLIVNGKDTKVKSSLKYINFKKTTLQTVKGAKSIKWAKNNKAIYKYKTTGKFKKPVCKKKSGKYVYTWKKVKTTTKTFTYNKKKKKWTDTSKKIKTQYDIYAKNKTTGKYELIDTVEGTKYVSKVKNVKVVPSVRW